MEIVDGKIKEIRDYHHFIPAKAASTERIESETVG
jgi:hypothetical protein